MSFPQRDSQIVSSAIVGAKHADGDDDGDCIAADVFRAISDLAGDAQSFEDLRLAVNGLRDELTAIEE